MSLSLDKLRLLRRQAGDPKASTPAAADVPPAPPAPVAANDARQPPAERSVFAWVEQEIRHKPTGAAAPATAPSALRRPEVGSLHRLLGLRTRGGPAPARASAQDRQLPGEEIAPGLFLIESLQPQAIPAQPLSLDFARRDGEHVAARDLLFFDTETTGLAGGTGTRAFMIGAADWHVPTAWRRPAHPPAADGHDGRRGRDAGHFRRLAATVHRVLQLQRPQL